MKNLFDHKAKISRPAIKSGRVIVTSDVHANIPYFEGLLNRLHFNNEDTLIIDGDFLEKGEKSLEMLRLVMDMSRGGNVYPTLGNCDEWQLIFDWGTEGDQYMARYIRGKAKGRGLICDMLRQCGVDPIKMERLSDHLPELKSRFTEEWDFLASLPHAIETENYVFAHAGMNGLKKLDENFANELLMRDRFLDEGQCFSKWVVCGHWPCVLYHEKKVCANPIVDAEHKIISIDGGCVLKDDGQLNALIIPNLAVSAAGSLEFDYYDPFPVKTITEDQVESSESYYIRWGDSTVEVLERGEEFSRCRHVRTGYEMDILTKYLFTEERITGCNDCSDYVLPLKAGDRVSIVEETSRGYYVKHNGVSGWYFGALT